MVTANKKILESKNSSSKNAYLWRWVNSSTVQFAKNANSWRQCNTVSNAMMIKMQCHNLATLMVKQCDEAWLGCQHVARTPSEASFPTCLIVSDCFTGRKNWENELHIHIFITSATLFTGGPRPDGVVHRHRTVRHHRRPREVLLPLREGPLRWNAFAKAQEEGQFGRGGHLHDAGTSAIKLEFAQALMLNKRSIYAIISVARWSRPIPSEEQ